MDRPHDPASQIGPIFAGISGGKEETCCAWDLYCRGLCNPKPEESKPEAYHDDEAASNTRVQTDF